MSVPLQYREFAKFLSFCEKCAESLLMNPIFLRLKNGGFFANTRVSAATFKSAARHFSSRRR